MYLSLGCAAALVGYGRKFGIMLPRMYGSMQWVLSESEQIQIGQLALGHKCKRRSRWEADLSKQVPRNIIDPGECF